ncbi:MAG: hypothetical protein MJA84_07150 [Firmicutes bacterium]|nr:hypothetical protein [Bacillota bacterium]
MKENIHYIKLDDQNRIVKGFSNAFEQPEITDICINEHGGRHFELNGQINPPLFNNQGIPLYKWDGTQVIERTQQEIQSDIDALPPAPKTELEILRETVDQLVIDSLGGV